jgi:hypothetical protein
MLVYPPHVVLAVCNSYAIRTRHIDKFSPVLTLMALDLGVILRTGCDTGNNYLQRLREMHHDWMCPDMYMYVCMCVCVYIYTERERERERETHIRMCGGECMPQHAALSVLPNIS